jgi:hypothetical protein
VSVRREAEKLFSWDKVSGHQSQDGADDLTQLMDFIKRHKITSRNDRRRQYQTAVGHGSGCGLGSITGTLCGKVGRKFSVSVHLKLAQPAPTAHQWPA